MKTRIVRMNDLCFVVMPFGKTPDIAGIVDFDAVYRDLIVAAGLARPRIGLRSKVSIRPITL